MSETLARLIAEGEEDRAGLCTQFDECWHCRVLAKLRELEQRTAPYDSYDGVMVPTITRPTDASDEAILWAASDTASRLGLFAATWPEFHAFGLAVREVTRAVEPAIARVAQEEPAP